jgi:hypothetical protein
MLKIVEADLSSENKALNFGDGRAEAIAAAGGAAALATTWAGSANASGGIAIAGKGLLVMAGS